eukprot:6460393-Amphidinium_carterae.1
MYLHAGKHSPVQSKVGFCCWVSSSQHQCWHAPALAYSHAGAPQACYLDLRPQGANINRQPSLGTTLAQGFSTILWESEPPFAWMGCCALN